MLSTILSIGDELTSGLTTNTNASWISQQLTALGITTAAHLTVGDNLDRITTTIARAISDKPDVLIISGGLGPTEDDLTRQALAIALNEPLVEDPAALAALEAFFKARNRPMTPSNRVQALRPQSARCLPNPLGTAPGLAATLHNIPVFVVPGVPREMRQMITDHVLPTLRDKAGDRVTLTGRLATYGMGESQLGEKIKDLMSRGSNPAVGTTVADGIVSVRIYATGTASEAAALMAQTKATLRQRLGTLVYGEDAQTLQQAVTELLRQREETVATAESCTGGILAGLLTDTPGSSATFHRGWIAYANNAKTDLLGVDPALLATHGAVSEPVARAMAQGARSRANSTWALAITGIAGPDGGTPEKPVGTVWIALAGPQNTHAEKFAFVGTRDQIRSRAAQMALALLRWTLVGTDPRT